MSNTSVSIVLSEYPITFSDSVYENNESAKKWCPDLYRKKLGYGLYNSTQKMKMIGLLNDKNGSYQYNQIVSIVPRSGLL